MIMKQAWSQPPSVRGAVSIGRTSVRREDDSANTDSANTDGRTALMNPNYAYQLYQAQRVSSRAEIRAADDRLGRQAAAISRGSRRLARATVARLVSRAYRRRSPSWA